LSFRVTGRIIERKVDVGSHVEADDVLARLEPKEEEADVTAAEAGVQSAEAKLRQVKSTFERQKNLLATGFTTRRDYDQAEQDHRTAAAALDNARAQLSTARDRLSYTVLRAPAAGIITTRSMEAGQIAQAAQAVFKLAQDGPRDAVVNVQETVFGPDRFNAAIEIALVSNPEIRTSGEVREVAPAMDTATSAVRIKIGLRQTPPEMRLGSSVSVTAHAKPRRMVALPWSALFSDAGKAAVWVVDPQSRTTALRRVVIETFGNSDIVIRDGLGEGDIVVTMGTQLLRPTQKVAFAEEGKP
jgi:membrane fusion protein, multidrug efflux system